MYLYSWEWALSCHTPRAPHGCSHQRTLIDLLVIHGRDSSPIEHDVSLLRSVPPINSYYLCVPPLPRSRPSAIKRESNAVWDCPSRTPPGKPYSRAQNTVLRGIDSNRTHNEPGNTRNQSLNRSFARVLSESICLRFSHCNNILFRG
jgi:hypothetical protein